MTSMRSAARRAFQTLVVSTWTCTAICHSANSSASLGRCPTPSNMLDNLGCTVLPKTGLATGTQIRNVTLIIFDQNAVIASDQVSETDPSQGADPAKQALVTIDAGLPS